MKNSGFNFAFAPTVAVSHNPQWGRFYETMGQQE
jgi:beta-glucosidase